MLTYACLVAQYADVCMSCFVDSERAHAQYADVCMSCFVWMCAGRSGCLAIATDGALLVRSRQRETVGGAIKSFGI